MAAARDRAHREDDHRWAPVATGTLNGNMPAADKANLDAGMTCTLTIPALTANGSAGWMQFRGGILCAYKAAT